MSSIPITRGTLHTPESLLALGAIVVKQLDEEGGVSIRFSTLGEVELVDPFEVFDALPEVEVIQHFISHRVPEDRIARYLKERDERKAERSTHGSSV